MKNNISFFIPAYNCEGTVRESVLSILETNFHADDELIIVNDCSSDQTEMILNKCQQEYPFIKIINHSRNKGGASARNTAVENAKNELLFCLDSDNILAKNSIAPLKKYLNINNADVVSFQNTNFFESETSNIKYVWTMPSGIFSPSMGLSSSLSPGVGGNYLFTKKSWIIAGCYPEFAGALDTWGFGIRQLLTNAKVMVLENSFYYHRLIPNSYFLRDVWSRRKSMSIRATQILIPFFDLITEQSINYILSQKNRNVWLENIEKKHINLILKPKKSKIFQSEAVKFTITKRIISRIENITPNDIFSISFHKKVIKKVLKVFKKEKNEWTIATNGEKNILEALFKLPQDKLIIFDVGANVGHYTDEILLLSKRKKKNVEIHLFEPQEINAKILRHKYSNIEYIYVNDYGLSNKKEKLEMFMDEEGSELASIYNRLFFKSLNQEIKKTIINVNTLENYISENNIQQIDLLKIDVEGHELSVIQGLGFFLTTSNLIAKMIQFEYGGANQDSNTTLEDIYNLLGFAYNIGKINGKKIDFTNFSTSLENYAYSNYIAHLK